MDSLSSLNTSLPRSFPARQPNPDLHQAFKAAALSVAQLYKTAAADENSARSNGYQDALEDLLSFLDQQNLGLGDGEGWRVRQWATEKLSPTIYGSDAEDHIAEVPNHKAQSRDQGTKQPGSMEDISPIISSEPVSIRSDLVASQHSESQTSISETIPAITPRRDFYQFRSPIEDMETDHSSPAHTSTPKTHRRTTLPNQRGATMSLGGLGNGAGHKRRTPFADLDFLDFGKEGFGGGSTSKRPRPSLD